MFTPNSHDTLGVQSIINAFRQPTKFWSRSEILAKVSPVPNTSGIYGWYLRELPPGVPAAECVNCNGLTLLYIGIAPRPPAQNGRISSRTLRSRLRQHYALNAEGSTLRLTLGCLLAARLGIELRRVGSGARMTFEAVSRLCPTGWQRMRSSLGCSTQHRGKSRGNSFVNSVHP